MTRKGSGMSCRQARELLPLYADGDLESPTTALVTEHLAGCPACRARAELDRRLASQLATHVPAADRAASRTALRRRVMAEVEKEHRRRPWRQAAGRLGNAAMWVVMSTVTAALVLGIAISARPLAQRAWPASTPDTAAPAAGIGWEVVSEQVIASPYYWVVDGERVDRTPQLSPDGTKIAYLPTVDGLATDSDRLVVRDLATGKDLDLTPEAGYSYTSVRWSPDSRSLAFVKYRFVQDRAAPSELWRVDADGGNLKRLYALPGDVPMRGPGFAVLRWSANGQYIVTNSTIWGGGGGAAIRASDGQAESIALPTAADFGAREDALTAMTVISPADDYVLHVAKTDGLLVPPKDAPAGGCSLLLFDLKSKESRVLGSFEGTIYVSDASISPEGNWISFTTLVREADATPKELKLWTVRRDGSALHEVTLNGRPAPAHMPGPLWAGGGRAYFNQPPEVSAIWIYALDAASGQVGLIGHKYPARDLVSVSRDGRRLLVVRGEWETAHLDLLTLAPKLATTLTATPSPDGLGVAPERLVAYHGGQSDTFGSNMGVFASLVAEMEKALLAVRPGAGAGLKDPALEASRIKGQQVAIEAVYPAPGISPAGQGPFTTALIQLDQATSPHEVTILLGSDRYTQVVTADADEALQMLRRILGVPQPVAVVPQFGTARDLFTVPPSAGFYRVSPDGQWVLYPVPGGPTADGGTIKPHLEAHKTSGGEVATVEIVAAESDLSGEGHYTWFPDSQRLLVVTSGDRGQILVKALGAQAAQTLLEAPQGSAGFGEAAISPDGARIAFSVLHPADPAPVPKIGIEVMSADGSGRREIVTPDYFIGKLAWTPDGTQVVYFKGKGGTPPEDGDAYVVDATSGEAELLFPQLRLAAWSPSGTQALWVGEPADPQGRAELYLSAWPPAGEPQIVARDVALSGVAWAGSDGWFVYSEGGALYLAQNGGREQLIRLTLESEVADGPVWAPGLGLIYCVQRDGGIALSLLPLTGAEPVDMPAARGQAQVSLSFFSGIAPPTWELSAAQMQELVALLAGLERTTQPLPQPPGPGYGGFLLTPLDESAAGVPERLRVCSGVAEVQMGGETCNLTDPERRLERWLLGAGRAAIGETLYGHVEAAIAHDASSASGS